MVSDRRGERRERGSEALEIWKETFLMGCISFVQQPTASRRNKRLSANLQNAQSPCDAQSEVAVRRNAISELDAYGGAA